MITYNRDEHLFEKSITGSNAVVMSILVAKSQTPYRVVNDMC